MNLEKGQTYWFVMLRCGLNGEYPVPMEQESDLSLEDESDTDLDMLYEVVLFESKEEAVHAAEQSPVGRARGYEVYEWKA